MAALWGTFFQLGGISGVPFVGKSGYKAFLGHTPTDGNIYIIYGPHIGVTDKGEIGKFMRPGMNEYSKCCYSLNTAWESLARD
jgi:hypothetical protein